jgi:MFS family permease
VKAEAGAEAYRENRVLVWLCAVIFLTQLGFGGIVPVVPLYALEFGVSQWAIGLTIAVYGLARFLVSVPTGSWPIGWGGAGRWCWGKSSPRWKPSLRFVHQLRTVPGLSLVARAGSAMVITSGQISLADVATCQPGAGHGHLPGCSYSRWVDRLPGGLLASFGLDAPFRLRRSGVFAGVVAFSQVPEARDSGEGRMEGAEEPGEISQTSLCSSSHLFSQVGLF